MVYSSFAQHFLISPLSPIPPYFTPSHLPCPSVAVPGVVLIMTTTGVTVSLFFSTHIVNSPPVSLTVTFGRPKLTVTAEKKRGSKVIVHTLYSYLGMIRRKSYTKLSATHNS